MKTTRLVQGIVILTVLSGIVFGFRHSLEQDQQELLVTEPGATEAVPTDVSQLPLDQAEDAERITHFTSSLIVKGDGTLRVVESIAVHSLDETIHHGIYRDLPTIGSYPSGLRKVYPFTVLGAKRDGQSEPYHVERKPGGIRIYLGDKDVLIPPGDYDYELIYETERQLVFGVDTTDLHWNVTGNDWEFPIDGADAFVYLPPDVESGTISFEAATGPRGASERDWTARIERDPDTKLPFLHYQTTNPLTSGEGLTVSASWPAGSVLASTPSDERWWLLWDNAGLGLLALGVLGLLIYFVRAWWQLGRDPQPGTLVPQYEPPAGFSPGLANYLIHAQRDSYGMGGAELLTSIIVRLAQRGALTIQEQAPAGLGATVRRALRRRPEYTLIKQSLPRNLAPEEELVYRQLFSKHRLSVDLADRTPAFKSRMESLRTGVQTTVRRQIIPRYFVTNARPSMLGCLGSIALLSGVAVLFGGPAWLLSDLVGLQLLFGLTVILLVGSLLVPRYTAEGRRALDHLLGFRWFLSVTERDRLNFHHPPERTPELFERLLPYAIALGVGHAWAEQFQTVLAAAHYQPAWYVGSGGGSFSASALSGSLASSLSASVSASSSSGGGGGGGGW